MEIVEGKLIRNEVNQNAMGGTEIMTTKLFNAFEPEFFKRFQIIASRVRGLREDKIRIYVCHDLPSDDESQHLNDGGWKKFHKIVFVSHWQKNQYQIAFNIPPSHCVVLQNAIVPLPAHEKPTGRVNIVYHTTPHRGLDIAVAALDYLSQKVFTKDEFHFHVYSSFKIYGWESRDEQHAKQFDFIKNHKNMTHYGSVPNEEVRQALQNMHIFAYPSVWQETSCISLMEAMSAGCMCVHPDFATLPETAANWTDMYAFNEDVNTHFNQYIGCLEAAIKTMIDPSDSIKTRLKGQQSYANLFYNWELRKIQWRDFLTYMDKAYPDTALALPEENMFEYDTGI